MHNINILCFSFDPWSNFWKRKQKLLFLLSKEPGVNKVLYAEAPRRLFDLTDSLGKLFLRDENKSFWQRGVLRTLTSITPSFFLFSPVLFFPFTRSNEFLHDLSVKYFLRVINRHMKKQGMSRYILWLYHPRQLDYVQYLSSQPLLIVYDWTDDWVLSDTSLDKNERNRLVALQDELLKTSGLIFTVSSDLFRRAKKENPNTYLIPNGANFELFSSVALDSILVDEEIKRLKKPIIGYTGQITSRIDFKLVKLLAQAKSDWSFVFIGPVFGAETKKEIEENLKDIRNVYFLGPRDQGVLPAFVKGFDVCMIPHKVDPLTKSMDPIKLYDYLSTGKPIVSTNVAGTEKFSDLISIAHNEVEFSKKLEDSLADSSMELIKRRQSIAQENCWQNRANEVASILQRTL